VLAEDAKSLGVQANRPATITGLDGREIRFAVCVVVESELLLDCERAQVELNIRPSKPEQFAAAHACVGGDPVQRVVGLAPHRLKVGEYLDTWLSEVVKPSARNWTYVGYETVVRLHLKPTLGRVRLDRLTPMQVQSLLNAESADGLAPKYVKNVRAVLRGALNQAVRWELLSRNPASMVEPPRGEPYEIKPLAPVEARAFLAAIRGDRLEALYSVALTMGLRQGEALGLRWTQTDLDVGSIRVEKQLQRLGGKLQLVELKTRLSRRALLMPPSIVASLREHQRRQLEERGAAGGKWIESGLVFTTPEGKPLEGTSVTRYFHDLLARAGLPQRRFHDLRHSCATLLLVQGVSPRVVMDVLGHSDIGMTMNTYSHVIPELRREAADRMDDLLRERDR
jgi:integrase